MLMKNYTQAHWSKAEDEILSSSLIDEIELQVLEMKLPRRSPAAIARRALSAGYGTKVVDGVKILHKDVQRRNRSYKAVKNDLSVDEYKKVTTAGESRTVPPVNEPTTSESLDNLPDVIVADNTQNINRDALKHIYDDINTLLSSEHYQQIASITVTLENTVLTVTRGKL